MTGIEANTVRDNPKGRARGEWRQRTGSQTVDVTADPSRTDRESEFFVRMERRWGHQLGDTRTVDFYLPREGAEVLRDALTAALEWTAD